MVSKTVKLYLSFLSFLVLFGNVYSNITREEFDALYTKITWEEIDLTNEDYFNLDYQYRVTIPPSSTNNQIITPIWTGNNRLAFKTSSAGRLLVIEHTDKTKAFFVNDGDAGADRHLNINPINVLSIKRLEVITRNNAQLSDNDNKSIDNMSMNFESINLSEADSQIQPQAKKN